MKKLEDAEKLLSQCRYQEAIELYEEVHQAFPEEESALLMLSLAYYDSGATNRAVASLEILLESELKRKIFTGFAFDELVRICKKEKKFSKLLEVCEKVVARQPNDVALLVELGNACLLAGNAQEACRVYGTLVHLENDNPAFYCCRGEALFAAGLYVESEAAYLQAGKIDPDQADVYYFKLADLFTRAGHLAQALKLLEKCLSVNPANPLYYCSMGDILIDLGKVEDGLAKYETAAKGDRSGAYYNRLGNKFMKEKLFGPAADAFQKAIDCEALQIFYLNLASAYQAMGQPRQAGDTLTKAAKVR